ncbi:MOSC domain-containing protein [Gordonia soli]|uniref:MOSC domain-containing protein n=1 Tax=Gordonia soli NBRC 108243 TaxID=1223545 RepID=M0QGF5_9ACTN|nr:MOSC domain-containing protein [Gordonia soli]GAC67356.1 hypothetical protein GS4_07_01050 [Gordonia soli NBRC 108243]
MAEPRVLTVSVGRVVDLPWRGRAVASAIRKTPQSGPVMFTPDGAVGDQQADRRHHGGPDKAALAYPVEHYARWSDEIGRDLEVPAFGENLTTEGLLESTAVLGTVYEVGTAILQVSQPRRPCFKLAAAHAVDDMAVVTERTGRTGVYLRVLRAGEIRAGDRFETARRPSHGITAAEVHRVLNIDRHDLLGSGRLLHHRELLPEAWVTLLRRRFDGELDDQNLRLHGAPQTADRHAGRHPEK